jgi:hypothetical protein
MPSMVAVMSETDMIYFVHVILDRLDVFKKSRAQLTSWDCGDVFYILLEYVPNITAIHGVPNQIKLLRVWRLEYANAPSLLEYIHRVTSIDSPLKQTKLFRIHILSPFCHSRSLRVTSTILSFQAKSVHWRSYSR